uniref:Uncharacterized protein n=1 Tax=viral metagenome TaxID=1070528 RepID=A0A6H1ZH22_9ZZZZ
MAEDKICPLLLAGLTGNAKVSAEINNPAIQDSVNNLIACKRKNCAWWNDYERECAILSASYTLAAWHREGINVYLSLTAKGRNDGR